LATCEVSEADPVGLYAVDLEEELLVGVLQVVQVLPHQVHVLLAPCKEKYTYNHYNCLKIRVDSFDRKTLTQRRHIDDIVSRCTRVCVILDSLGLRIGVPML
jgi:hypothetical protein